MTDLQTIQLIVGIIVAVGGLILAFRKFPQILRLNNSSSSKNYMDMSSDLLGELREARNETRSLKQEIIDLKRVHELKIAELNNTIRELKIGNYESLLQEIRELEVKNRLLNKKLAGSDN